MPDKRIKELLKKFLNGTASPEEQKLVDEWYESLPGPEDIQLSDNERADLRASYWNSIENEMRTHKKHRALWPMVSIAAAVSAIVCFFVFFVPSFKDEHPRLSSAQTKDNFQRFENQSGDVKVIMLSDSSIVTLSPGSEIRIPLSFNEADRRLELSGEAFFDIYRDKSKPFLVVANEVVTRVLGTSFTVTAYPGDSDITVAVATGTVSVYAHVSDDILTPGKENVVLTPNQQAIYNKSERKVSRLLVKEPQIVIPKEEAAKIRFEGIAVSEIFKTLEKMYGVDIDFDEKAFSTCSITTSVTGKNLYERIDVICEITGATYTIEDARIRISGSGCN